MLEKGHWGSPLPLSICPTPGGLEGPAHSPCSPTGPQPRLPLIQLWTVTPTVGTDTHLSPTQMRERSLTSICACAASWVTFTDCTAWEDTAVTQVPQLPAQEPDPTHGPAYPIKQFLRGQNFAIFIQPGEEGNPKLPDVKLGLLSPPMMLPGPLPTWGTGAQLPVCLTQHQARIHRVEVSLHLPACCLGVLGREHQGQWGRFQVKATGSKSVHIINP